MYIRMTFRAVEVFELLEPLLKDYRKLRLRSMGASKNAGTFLYAHGLLLLLKLTITLASAFLFGRIFHLLVPRTAGYTLTFMDEFVDSLLTEERVCDIILPRLTKREVLEETEGLGPRPSALLNAMEGSDSEDGRGRSQVKRGSGSSRSSKSSSSKRSSSSMPNHRSDSKGGSRAGSAPLSQSSRRFVSRSPSRSKSRSPSVGSRYRSRSRDLSPDRMTIEENN